MRGWKRPSPFLSAWGEVVWGILEWWSDDGLWSAVLRACGGRMRIHSGRSLIQVYATFGFNL